MLDHLPAFPVTKKFLANRIQRERGCVYWKKMVRKPVSRMAVNNSTYCMYLIDCVTRLHHAAMYATG